MELQVGSREALYQIMLARYYSSSLGRFMAVDPGNDTTVGDPQSWNKYSYTGNNPLIYIDPNGEERYVIVVGDRGLGPHNAGRNFERAAATRQAALTAAGHDVTVSRASSVSQMNQAITSGPAITGGVIYYGHGWQGTLYIGQGPEAGTNLTSANVGQLSGANLGPGASVELNGCMSGAGGADSMAQQVATQLGVPTTGSTTPMSFTPTPGQPMTGGGAVPPETGPLYMTPDAGGTMANFTPATPPPTQTPRPPELNP
jgi:RHS repeat-associated protein